MEYELKLRVCGAEDFQRRLEKFCRERYRSVSETSQTDMQSVYYDTEDSVLCRAGVSLRFRRENGKGVVCVKKRLEECGGVFTRDEWEAPAESAANLTPPETDRETDALLGAVREKLTAVCSASFARTAFTVDTGGAVAEIAFDRGYFNEKENSFSELEIEHLSGDPGETERVAAEIKNYFSLEAETESKQERARKLKGAAEK